MSRLNIAHYLDCTEVEGPGKRFAIWVQGCLRRCDGCCNPQFQDFVPKTIVDTAQLCMYIEASHSENKIEGVTFLGGEPMLQAKGLSEIAQFCREHGLSVMTFTGYVLEELRNDPLPFADELLQYTDLLVDGAYDKTRPEKKRNWVGSTNQRFHFLSAYYKRGIELDERYSHGFELRIRSDGTMVANGFPWETIVDQDNQETST